MPSDQIDKIKAENFNKDLKHANEHYDEIIDQVCPSTIHRGDTSTINRLLGFTDAMMATCATFLVLPLRNLKEMEGHSLAEFINDQRVEFIVYFLGFLVICTIWETINVRCIIIKRLDDILVLLSMLQLLAITVLPFSLALQGHFPQEAVTTVITIITLVAVELLELCIIFYAFSRPRLIHYATRKWSTETTRKFRLLMLLKPICNLVVVILAGMFSLLDYRISYVFVCLLILVPIIRKFILFLARRRITPQVWNSCSLSIFYSKGNIRKERVEAFSDAAVAIIACILILDITVEEFPKSEYVDAHGLVSALQHMLMEFVVFVGAFVIVALLWYVNHTILNLFHTINIVVLYLQKIFLAVLCLAPLTSGMMNRFFPKEDGNSILTARVTTGLGLVSSSCNLVMLLYGYYKGEKFLHKWADKGNFKENRDQHLYVLLKALIMPFWCILSFIGSFGGGAAARYVFYICFLLSALSFIVLKLVFLKTNNGNRDFDDQEDAGEERETEDFIQNDNVELEELSVENNAPKIEMKKPSKVDVDVAVKSKITTD